MSHGHIGSRHSGYAVKGEIIKQLTVVGLVTAIAVWQHHFVLSAASADVYIFALLFSAAVFGIYHTIHGTHKLAHEFIALHAMMEIYADAVWHDRDPKAAKAAQAARTRLPARVYKLPHSLATAHNLIVEEAQRNGHFRISTGTMQVLVADLETKIDDRHGMAHYLGALLVLLGLLGTFIGLMHTLESVGGILGSIDVSGSAGPGAIGKLIESLKLPLEGMSTGFGASLLGLIGSLIVGFLSRIDTIASNRLKHEFETWIRGTVQLEAANSGDPASVAELPEQQEQLQPRVLLKVARMTVATMAQLTEQVATMAKAVDDTRAEVAAQRSELHALAHNTAAAVTAQNRMVDSVASIGGSVGAMRDQFKTAAGTLNATLDVHLQAHSDAAKVLAQEIRQLSTAQGGTHAGLEAIQRTTGQLGEEVSALAQNLRQSLDTAAARAQAKLDDETADLIADLDHLITASRLSPHDLNSLRHLSAIAQEAAGTGGIAQLRAVLEQEWQRGAAQPKTQSDHEPLKAQGKIA